MSEILKIEHLSLSFFTPHGEIKAVKDVSLSLNKGEILGIVGESGCGKSVLCKSITKLLPGIARITSGRIIADGRDITDYSEQEMSVLRGDFFAYVFQNPMTALNPTLTVGEQIAEAIRLHEARHGNVSLEDTDAGKLINTASIHDIEGETKLQSSKFYKSEKDKSPIVDSGEETQQKHGRFYTDRIREKTVHLLELVGIEDANKRIDSYPHEFSGGMRQRAVIAMALASEPKVILADEPTTALDERIGAEILKLFDRIRRELGTSIILISHDLGAVRSVADRIMVMYGGNIVESGTTDEIFNKAQHQYTDLLLSALPENADGSDDGKNELLECRLFGEKNKTNETELSDDKTDVDKSILIDIRNLSYTYHLPQGISIHALRDINLSIRQGEIFGIMGESGSGKSTLAKCIMNILSADSGHIIYKGINICERSAWKKERKALAASRQLIFQDSSSSLDPRMKIADIIAEPMRIAGIKACMEKEKVRRLMEQVGLEAEYADRYPAELSGGQRQRAAIARAISVNPELIIADEALASLDAPIQMQIAKLFKRMQQEYGFTLIFISHDMRMVNYLCDRAALIKHGRVARV